VVVDAGGGPVGNSEGVIQGLREQSGMSTAIARCVHVRASFGCANGGVLMRDWLIAFRTVTAKFYSSAEQADTRKGAARRQALLASDSRNRVRRQ